MSRLALCLPITLLVCLPVFAASGPEVIDPQEAEQDPDFLVQGEYTGQGTLPDGSHGNAGAQVIALGNGQFRVVLYRGGLPGAGWSRGDAQFAMDGRREGDVTQLSGEKLSGAITDGKLTVNGADGEQLLELKRADRQSPTLGEKPPAGAIVLFDGTSADQFKDGELTDMQTLQAGCTAKDSYPIRRLHIEFRLSWKPQARGQGRSNSGVYIGGIPEIQVLDSFGLEGKKNECGALYGRRPPDVNMCLPPMVWQTYDVQFTEPPLAADGSPAENIRVTVRHNGVVIHDGYDTRKKEHGPRRLHLQRHGNRVQYRNIWIEPIDASKPDAT